MYCLIVYFVSDEKVLVFVETKRSADFIAVYLSEQHIPTTSIHGDRMQREREIALNDFKYNRMRVLVATAVAARGLGKCETSEPLWPTTSIHDDII